MWFKFAKVFINTYHIGKLFIYLFFNLTLLTLPVLFGK